jgi:uncharacterized protein (TIGR02147 family)
METDPWDVPTFLARCLIQRQNRNPRYSLRAFARDLGIAPSLLSDVINRRKGISVRTAREISRRLELDTRTSRLLELKTLERFSRHKATREHARKILRDLRRTSGFHTVPNENFETISSWYANALLELTELPNFRADIPWIAKRLSVPETVIRATVDCLLSQGLLTGDHHSFKCAQTFTAVPGGVPSSAIREHHRQVLNMALTALETQDIYTRESSTLTLAVPRARMDEAAAMLRKFRMDFAKKCAEWGEPDSVYAMSLHLFRLDKDVADPVDTAHDTARAS